MQPVSLSISYSFAVRSWLWVRWWMGLGADRGQEWPLFMARLRWASLIPSLEQFTSQPHNYTRMAEEGAQGRKWAVVAGFQWGRRVLKATSADTAAKRNVHWITAQWHVQPNPVEVLSVRDKILLSSPVCFDVIYSAPSVFGSSLAQW